MIRPGEIYHADLLDAGRRPVLIVSREENNRGDYVVAVAFTTARLEQRRHLDTCVTFRGGEFGLTRDCVAQCETISSLHKEQLDPRPIGRLDAFTFRSVIKAIGGVISADCEPS